MTIEVVVLVFALITILVFGFVMWKVFSQMTKVTGASFRASEQERRQYFQLVERVWEKSLPGDPGLKNQLHAQERVADIQAMADVQKHLDEVENAEKIAREIHDPTRIKEADFYAGPDDIPLGEASGELL